MGQHRQKQEDDREKAEQAERLQQDLERQRLAREELDRLEKVQCHCRVSVCLSVCRCGCVDVCSPACLLLVKIYFCFMQARLEAEAARALAQQQAEGTIVARCLYT